MVLVRPLVRGLAVADEVHERPIPRRRATDLACCNWVAAPWPDSSRRATGAENADGFAAETRDLTRSTHARLGPERDTLPPRSRTAPVFGFGLPIGQLADVLRQLAAVTGSGTSRYTARTPPDS